MNRYISVLAIAWLVGLGTTIQHLFCRIERALGFRKREIRQRTV